MSTYCSFALPPTPMLWHPQPLRPSSSPLADAEAFTLQSCESSPVDYMSLGDLGDYFTHKAISPNWSEYVQMTDYFDFSMDPYASPASSVDFSNSYSPGPSDNSALSSPAYSPKCSTSTTQFDTVAHEFDDAVHPYQLPAASFISPTDFRLGDLLPSWDPRNPAPGWTPPELIPFEPYTCELPPAISPPELRVASRKRGSTGELTRCLHSRQSRKRTRLVDGPSVGAEMSTTTTPFITKLVHLLSQPQYRELIRWNNKGNTILFLHASPQLLELFAVMFRHSNASSFIRQLNIYGFNRAAVQQVDLDDWPSEMGAGDVSAFSQPYFFCDTNEVRCDTAALKPRPPKPKDHTSVGTKRRQRTLARRSSRTTLEADEHDD